MLLLAIWIPGWAQQKNRDAAGSLKKFLRNKFEDKSTRYASVFRDLNSDGVPEAIIYVISNEWCGRGGCPLLILQRNGNSWKITTQTTITNPPIRVLPTTSHGWHDLGVEVAGGGIQPGYEAELRFDGKSYPRNPSVPPAQHLRKGVTGEVVIRSTKDAVPLFQ